MRIVCPSCTAAYDVPESKLVAGRAVKCAQCGAGWAPVVAVLRTTPPPRPAYVPELLPDPVDPEAATQEPAAPAPIPVADAPPATLPTGGIVWAGWVASIALLALLAVAAYAWRAEVMRAWPESERAYALLGLAGR